MSSVSGRNGRTRPPVRATRVDASRAASSSAVTVLVAIVLCVALPVPGTAAEDPLQGHGEVVRVEVTPAGFGSGRSPLLESEPGARSLDEAYEAQLIAALVEAGFDVRADAPRALRTWVFAGADVEAVVRWDRSGSEPPLYVVVAYEDGGAGRTLFEALATATAEVLVPAETGRTIEVEGFRVWTTGELIAELDRRSHAPRDELRREIAIERLGRLQDPRGLDALRSLPPADDAEEFVVWAREGALEPPDPTYVARRDWQRGIAAATRGEMAAAAAYLETATTLDPKFTAALYARGDLLLQGAPGVDRDVDTGLDLIGRAMRAGHPDAAYLWGYVHARGELVPRDLVEAAVGFSLAADTGHEQAAGPRDAVAARLTEEQAAAVERRREEIGVTDELEGPLLAGVWDVTNPILIERTKRAPVYPLEARQRRKTGNVILQAVIRKDGSVEDVKVLRCKPTGYGFERAAIEAVEAWRYRPARQHGRPVDVYFTINVAFTLH